MRDSIRVCSCDADAEFESIRGVMNAAASVYEGRIPAELWRDPFISEDYLVEELRRGVCFLGAYSEDKLVAVMATQAFDDCALIRHAYVHPNCQRNGLGSLLLRSSLEQGHSTTTWLVGCLKAMTWAISFYEKHGFSLVKEVERDTLRAKYWTLSAAHVKHSVVLRYRVSLDGLHIP